MASDTDAAAICMNLRFLINKKTGKILYAEAGKDFVDLLFSFLTLPIGSVMKLLSELKPAKKVGSLSNVYKSVEKLQITMFMNADKSPLLEPSVMCTNPNDILRIKSAPTVYYLCGSQTHYGGSTHYMATQSGGRCACNRNMIYPVHLQNPSTGDITNHTGSSGEGYVKETVTFIITNDLEISPSSTITSINLLNKLNFKDQISDLGERNVSVGLNEALELLRASLVSTTPLNDVFGVSPPPDLNDFGPPSPQPGEGPGKCSSSIGE